MWAGLVLIIGIHITITHIDIEIKDLYSNAVMRDGDVYYPTRIGLGII